MEANTFKCPCCGSALVWDGRSGEMKCDSCGNTYPVETLEQLKENGDVQENGTEDFSWDMPAQGTVKEEDREHLRAFTCPSCGSQMVVSDTSAASECPYCGNPAVMPEVLSGDFKPEAVIPFKKTKEEAKAAFRALCKGKKLLPKGFADEARVEKITGVYVPFWLFDCDTDADVTYAATRVSMHRQGNYEVTRTAHYHVRRGGKIDFSGVPVNSSTKLDDTLMEAVEPFDMKDQTGFSPAYLSGSQAERYDIGTDKCVERANQRIRESVQRACAATVIGYTTAVPVSTRIKMDHGKAKNVMMPVWMLNTKYHDKQYTFAMNGQTGRLIGNLPVAKDRAFAWAAGLLAGTTAGGWLIAFLLYAMGVLG